MTFFPIRRLLAASALLLALAFPALAEELEIGTLTPTAYPSASEETYLIDLYCGPTQGSYRDGEATLDASQPFLYFGQYDCWAMVAQGTDNAMGAVGWIESASINLPDEPQLAFEDAFLAMVEEDTFLTVTPLMETPEPLFEISQGTQVILLAQYEGWGYVQTEIDGVPVRAFLPLAAIL